MKHWQLQQQLDSHSTHRLNKILFVNDMLGYVVGGDRFSSADILITRDGGYTWQLQDHPEAGKELFDVVKGPRNTVYTCGFDGKILWTANDGATWSFRQLPSFNPNKAIAFNDHDSLRIVGGISFEVGYIDYSDSVANTPNNIQLTNYELNDLKILPGGIGYMAGYGVIRKTLDGGASWQFQNVNKDNFKTLDVHDAQTVYTCGGAGGIFKTTDGGANWQCLRNGDDLSLPRYYLNGLVFINESEGYAVGENGVVIYTDDGGKHWEEFDKFTTQALFAIARCPNGDLLVSGDGGTLFRLTKK